MDQNKMKTKHPRSSSNSTRTGSESESETLLVIKLPDPKVLQLVSRSLFLALIFVTFPSIGSLLKALDNAEDPAATVAVAGGGGGGGFDLEQLDSVLRGLAEEGLLTKSHRVLVIGPGAKSAIRGNPNIFAATDSATDDETFDLVYASDLVRDGDFADRAVGAGGIVAFPLGDKGGAGRVLSRFSRTNYKIVYLRRFSSTVVAMRKIGPPPAMRRQLLHSPSAAAAVEGPEEALLEPPRRRGGHHWRRVKFLPGSLEGFRRRVFVNVAGSPGQRRDAARWFDETYPKMGWEFEVYDLEVVAGGGEEGGDVSEWLRKNVREDEYVVMKAEAEAVEEMVDGNTIRLVDELFFECNNDWWRGKSKGGRSNRAYWECLALYGRVMDEGVAVHQWWG